MKGSTHVDTEEQPLQVALSRIQISSHNEPEQKNVLAKRFPILLPRLASVFQALSCTITFINLIQNIKMIKINSKDKLMDDFSIGIL